MRYYLKEKLIPLKEAEGAPSGCHVMESITISEYKQRFEKTIHYQILSRSLGHEEYCKADVLKGCVAGTFLVPVKENLLEREIGLGYYLRQNHLIFISDSPKVEHMLNEMIKRQVSEKTGVAQILLEFIEYLIRDDMIFLQRFEESLERIEEGLQDGDIGNYHKSLLKKRRELLKLNACYEQMVDLCDTLEENQNNILTEVECRMFHFVSKRISRYCDTARMLREYSMQLTELCQSQIDMRQNEIMKFLTVVTTIFMPLTLIAGWYGMNFANMPELNTKYGYLFIIIVSAAVVLLEYWYFKRKKWLK